MSSIENIPACLKGKRLRYKIKTKQVPLQEQWSSWMIQPAASYLETASDGPVSIKDIEWIDIDPIEKSSTGRLMEEKIQDHTIAITALLQSINISCITVDHFLRVIP